MKESKPLGEDLCFVVRLHPQSLSCVDRPETFLQFAQDILVHGITSSESARSSMGTSGSARHYKVFPSGKQFILPNNIANLHTRNSLCVPKIRFGVDAAGGRRKPHPDDRSVQADTRYPGLALQARATLEAENLVLRQQLNVLRRRTPKRPAPQQYGSFSICFSS